MTKVESKKFKPSILQDEMFTLLSSIESSLEENNAFMNKTQPVNITLSRRDIEKLENQIDRAIALGLRTKNRSAIIRMAIRALEASSNDKYFALYHQD